MPGTTRARRGGRWSAPGRTTPSAARVAEGWTSPPRDRDRDSLNASPPDVRSAGPTRNRSGRELQTAADSVVGGGGQGPAHLGREPLDQPESEPGLVDRCRVISDPVVCDDERRTAVGQPLETDPDRARAVVGKPMRKRVADELVDDEAERG